MFYSHNNSTGEQRSLGTKDKSVARQLIYAKNQAALPNSINRQMAKVYLQASDSAAAERTWQHVMDEAAKTKTGNIYTDCPSCHTTICHTVVKKAELVNCCRDIVSSIQIKIVNRIVAGIYINI